MNSGNQTVSDVGILGLEIYFPRKFVDQELLEEFDGVSKGKYTVGLGQSKMGFCDDREDVNSLCLTAVQSLMEKMKIGYEQIGRLEVGTETLLDKSKSAKTVIMQLFESSGNADIEGVDTINACYGGTSALFNAISWIQSPFWDGRFALVVAADIAVYASGSARPTGGAGAIAMLVGPNAPIVLNNVRATYMAHVYDFYKPDMVSEYPYVDGKLSIECYLSALDHCYQLCAKKQKATTSCSVTVDYFDYFCFHAPYCKLVQKSLARLFLNDLVRCDEDKVSDRFPGLDQYRNVKLEETYFDRNLEQALISCSKVAFQSKTQPTLLLANVIGNMYTPSLYGGLISLLISQPSDNLLGKRIGMFSYGSGLASSMFSLTITNDPHCLKTLMTSLSDVIPRLESRLSTPPHEFVEILKLKEETHHKAPYTPVGSIEALFPGTYYLVAVDSMYRRSYARKPIDGPTMTTE